MRRFQEELLRQSPGIENAPYVIANGLYKPVTSNHSGGNSSSSNSGGGGGASGQSRATSRQNLAGYSDPCDSKD